MYHITIQYAVNKELAPKAALLRQWAKKALKNQLKNAELMIRLVDTAEMTALNSTYRHKNKPTNVLSFPFELPSGVLLDTPILGDIVVCAEVVNREAAEQHKTNHAHWAHMIVHGVFHLLGHDHIDDHEAEIMESHEIKIMRALGFPNPYEAGDNIKNYE
ncbi:MAG: hypothetical protein ACD_46C00712G0004 [uncultured bacterium]|nr:MAG: hypothetical protein ACD_46C00712G0004 [uncultured bacterium]